MSFGVASEKSPEFPSSAASDNGPDSVIVKPTVLPSIVPTRPSPDSLTTLPEILSSLSLLESEEAELSSTLQELLANRDPVVSSLSRLHNLLPQLDELRTDAYLLTRKVSVTAETADRIGGSVRTLDEEMKRVREASDRVAQVMDLKVCPLTWVSLQRENIHRQFSRLSLLCDPPLTPKIGNLLHGIAHELWPCRRA